MQVSPPTPRPPSGNRRRFSPMATDRGVWIRFFGALGGLTLAFLAAIDSTVARESGNLLVTAISASLALLLAGVVGLTTVPYLARRVSLGGWRETVDYNVTREGLIYVCIVLVIGIAALNTGNNLLFIVVAAMVAAILVSGVASAAVLRGLELDVLLPPHVFAGAEVTAEIGLRNHRRLLPSFSVSLIPVPPRKRSRRLRLRSTTYSFPWWQPPEKRWLHLPDLAVRLEPTGADSPIFRKEIYFPYIPAQACVDAEVQLNFAQRGRYQQETFGLATRFPFSFLKKTRRIKVTQELLVYPSVEPIETYLDILPTITGACQRYVRGGGCDLYGIREYRPEDPRRHVDWKASAKTGELKVREFTREEESRLRIVFDNPAPGTLAKRDYENAVNLAASLAWYFAGENADLLFAAPGYSGGGDVYEILRYLAVVQPAAGVSVLDEFDPAEEFNLILTARPPGTIPEPIWLCSYVIFLSPPRNPGPE